MHHTTIQALGQARLAELHQQARHDALGRGLRARKQQPAHLAPRILAIIRWARRAGAAPARP
jgi:hypothetical protein